MWSPVAVKPAPFEKFNNLRPVPVTSPARTPSGWSETELLERLLSSELIEQRYQKFRKMGAFIEQPA